jgi:CBS domain-containing protein
MSIGEVCIRQVVVVSRDTRVSEGAKLMRQYHVGDLVVTDESNGKRVPVGIVTDRDIVLEVLAQDLDPKELSLGDVMMNDLLTVRESEGIFQTIRQMRIKGARRAPVVNNEDELVGIVSVDDLLELLSEELSELSKLIGFEQRREAEVRR